MHTSEQPPAPARGVWKLQMTHFAITKKPLARCSVLLLVALAACSDDPAPPTDSQMRALQDALCDIYGPVGSAALNGAVYDMSGCPD